MVSPNPVEKVRVQSQCSPYTSPVVRHIQKLIVDIKKIVDVCREKQMLNDKITYMYMYTQSSYPTRTMYLVCGQTAVHLKGLMVVQETHWKLWTVVCLQH